MGTDINSFVMKSQTEIAVRDGNFLVIDKELKTPKNKGQEKLLEYMHTQIILGNKADELEMRKIYFKYSMHSKGSYVPDLNKQAYKTWDAIREVYPDAQPVYWYAECYYPGYWKDYTIDSWLVKSGARNWLNRSIGSLVKNGFLILIPKGYILQRIEESKKKIND